MIVRALDQNGDWTFGAGLNDYKRNNDAVIQNIKTRLSSFVGNCFFDMGAGVDWFTFLSGKNEVGLNLAVSAVILNTQDVLGLVQLTINLSSQRIFSVSYQVQTSFSLTGDSFQFDLGGSLGT